LKCVRRDLAHAAQCHRTKHKSCVDNVENHHHSDVLGTPYSVDSTDKQMCCISSLFATLTSLLKESHLFTSELRIRLIRITTAAGTCCCFPPKILVSSIIAFLEKRDSSTYTSAMAFLERTLFRELGAYSITDVCDTCDWPANHSWEFLEIYVNLLCPSDPKLCYIVMAHLLKVTSGSRFYVREQLLLKVFYPTFLRAKASYMTDNENVTAKFLLQSCMSVMSCLIVNTQMCEKFMEINGLHETLPLMTDAAFTRSVYALLEVTVTVEIWKMYCEDSGNSESAEAPATKSLFESLDRETNDLLNSLRYFEKSKMETKMEQQSEKNIVIARFDDQEIETAMVESLDDATILLRLPDSDIHREQSENKTDIVVTLNSKNNSSEKLTLIEQVTEACVDADASFEKFSLHQASAAWRAAAGVALCSPKFRAELSEHPVSRKSLHLFKMLAVGIATDSIEGNLCGKIEIFEKLLYIHYY